MEKGKHVFDKPTRGLYNYFMYDRTGTVGFLFTYFFSVYATPGLAVCVRIKNKEKNIIELVE